MKIASIILLPLDGGELRWGWTWYGPPHPCLPAGRPTLSPACGRQAPEERGITG